jgi:transcriptional regulator with XRE-family HTH domain
MPIPSARSRSNLAETIRLLLAEKGLSLADVARRSRSDAEYGARHHVPHNLYDALRKRSFSPSLYQLAALSSISGYWLSDWLLLFGFSLDNVARFQIYFPALRTVELDASTYHSQGAVPIYRDLREASFDSPLTPLSRWLSDTGTYKSKGDARPAKTSFRFVKIGLRDAFAYPDILPGSIVRIAPVPSASANRVSAKSAATNLFLVEHGQALLCSRICRPQPNRILVCSKHLPYASMEFELGLEAALAGAADFEFRRTVRFEAPVVPKSLGGYPKPSALRPKLTTGDVGQFIRDARKRSGLSFREASHRTKVISRFLGDARYFCAPGSLSDYETRKTPPRHLHKLISICAVYFVSVAECFETAGVAMERLGKEPMPSRYLRPLLSREISSRPVRQSSFLTRIRKRFGELPEFLLPFTADFFGIPELSIRDVFWAGGVKSFLHPYLKRAVVLILDRRKKIPRSSLACPKWAQPLYVFLLRDGTYLCGTCVRANGVLAIHPATAGFPGILRLRDRTDAEVVGQIIGIVRRLS